YFLPFFRLAPVQCTSFGIQVTSGIGRMDYYLSSSLVEPPDAAEHYTEKLILAPVLLPYRHRAELPERPKTRHQLGLPDDGSLYVCAQHLGKFHPDFDRLIGAILRCDRRGVLAVVEDESGYVAARLRARFERTLPDVSERIVFLPRLATLDYRCLLASADVLLDPPYFGGMNSTYDALSVNRPMVTLPSPYHRGRVTLGCYRKMGLDECVAADSEDYVAQAVRLANEPDWREHVCQQIAQSSDVLFDNLDTVREHERIFERLLDGP
ncbi:MAG: hypothetical protein JW818_08545, partial [Pirellulales bacterium]|nr:hypothetical protein [Pirellulales bacterium]